MYVGRDNVYLLYIAVCLTEIMATYSFS
uniref:Uncharacterized protein n=1 Tax=Anguilla anguilla TaxID=7936 RepID=A0A0E9VJR7_ANGAN